MSAPFLNPDVNGDENSEAESSLPTTAAAPIDYNARILQIANYHDARLFLPETFVMLEDIVTDDTFWDEIPEDSIARILNILLQPVMTFENDNRITRPYMYYIFKYNNESKILISCLEQEVFQEYIQDRRRLSMQFLEALFSILDSSNILDDCEYASHTLRTINSLYYDESEQSIIQNADLLRLFVNGLLTTKKTPHDKTPMLESEIESSIMKLLDCYDREEAKFFIDNILSSDYFTNYLLNPANTKILKKFLEVIFADTDDFLCITSAFLICEQSPTHDIIYKLLTNENSLQILTNKGNPLMLRCLIASLFNIKVSEVSQQYATVAEKKEDYKVRSMLHFMFNKNYEDTINILKNLFANENIFISIFSCKKLQVSIAKSILSFSNASDDTEFKQENTLLYLLMQSKEGISFLEKLLQSSEFMECFITNSLSIMHKDISNTATEFFKQIFLDARFYKKFENYDSIKSFVDALCENSRDPQNSLLLKLIQDEHEREILEAILLNPRINHDLAMDEARLEKLLKILHTNFKLDPDSSKRNFTSLFKLWKKKSFNSDAIEYLYQLVENDSTCLIASKLKRTASNSDINSAADKTASITDSNVTATSSGAGSSDEQNPLKLNPDRTQPAITVYFQP